MGPRWRGRPTGRRTPYDSLLGAAIGLVLAAVAISLATWNFWTGWIGVLGLAAVLGPVAFVLRTRWRRQHPA